MSKPQGRSLVEKLGIERGATVAFLGAPRGYAKLLGELPEGVRVSRSAREGLDLAQLFATEKIAFEREFKELIPKVKQDGMVWVSWPKRSSKIPTDLSDEVVRKVGLANGMVDVKVCAIDESWSGLKFVRRLRDRR